LLALCKNSAAHYASIAGPPDNNDRDNYIAQTQSPNPRYGESQKERWKSKQYVNGPAGHSINDPFKVTRSHADHEPNETYGQACQHDRTN